MRNSFIVRFGVNLWLTSIGLTGPLGVILGFFASWIVGDLADRGIIKLDLTIDAYKEALKSEQWKEDALKAYNHASEKVYSEEEKDAIRKQYMDILAKFASYGNSMPNDEHT